MKAPKNFTDKIHEQILQTSQGKARMDYFNANGGNRLDDRFWVYESDLGIFKYHCLLFELDWSKYYMKIKKCPNGKGTNGEWIAERTFTKKDCLSLQNFMIMIKDEIETQFKYSKI